MSITKSLAGIKRNILLKNYTTFRIGGRAKYFFAAKTKKDLIKAVKWAKENNLPFFILGGGSNLLVSDNGFNGLVIKFGKRLSFYISKGIGWAAGIPGTIQGAVYGNAGGFKRSMKDIVEKVEVFNTKTEKIKIFKNKDCRFSYRNSIFKKKKNLIILSVKIKAKKNNSLKTKQYLDYRKKTQPLNYPSSGSIFKNPKGFFAGELIEKCSLKGKKFGNAQISRKHANFIVNLGGAKAKDVLKLINLVKKRAKKRFGIELEEEIQYLGLKN